MSVTVALQASYFFLSYAHSPPLAGTPDTPHDPWIRKFFADLDAVVRRRGSRGLSISPGFIDEAIPLGADWRASLLQALSSAEVFVPLYSPGYFAGSWPGREWACFEQRLIEAGVADPLTRFTPVLWIPLKPGENPRGLDKAMAIGAGDRAYAENGLRAMLRLAPYREAYLKIVERLAGAIVDLAERETIQPSPAPDIETIRSPFSAPSAAVFAVVVAAPPGSAMRPFPESPDLSLPEYVAMVAEQLDFAVSVAALDEATEQLTNTPGIVLIDPRFAPDDRRLDSLRHAVQEKPWVLPIIILGRASDAERGHSVKLALDVAPTRSDQVLQAVAGVNSLEQFVALIPFLVAEAERQFLRRGPIKRAVAPSGSGGRLRDAWTSQPGPAAGPSAAKRDLDDEQGGSR
jgi:hypothetical protein